jgi:ribosomal protein S18 acetylase RimI-like enzyme
MDDVLHCFREAVMDEQDHNGMNALTALRPATLADLDAVYALETAGFPSGIVERKSVFARRITVFPEGFLLRDSAPGRGLSAYFCTEIWRDWPGAGGAPAGLERFQLDHDIGVFHDPAGTVLYLASMTVAPGQRGHGAGRTLFREGISAMRGRFPALERMVLMVNEVWAGARAIYAGEGFAERGRIEGFFRAEGDHPRAAIIMERAL